MIIDSPSTTDRSDICQEIQSSVNCLVDNIATDTNIKEGICGNGVKDGNEECDCGGSSCADDHPCCTSNCKLKPGKMCSDENDSCCKQCQINPAGTLCRPATGFCDLEEKCDGASKSCPTDLYIADKTSCTNTGGIQAQCASGRWTSRNSMHEVGPRFELKCFEIKLGTIDMADIESEWVLRPFQNTAKKRNFL